MVDSIGISDITSSEGNLLDFSKIIWNIGYKDFHEKDMIFSEFSSRTKSKSKGSFDRKLSIMEKLGLIEFVNEKFILDSSGKVLNKIIEDLDGISVKKKIFYFILLFSTAPRKQLAKLLQVIDHQHGQTKKQIIQKYFETKIAKDLWNQNRIVEKNLRDLKEYNVMPSMFNNKFSCMKNWLESIGLVAIRANGYYPLLSSKIIKSLNDFQRIEGLYEDAAKVYNSKFRHFKIKNDYEDLIKFVKDAHNSFCTAESGLSDIQSVARYVCIELLCQDVILEEQTFFELTGKLKENGVIRSIMAGRKGKPVHLRLN